VVAPDAAISLAVTHDQLGLVYGVTGDLDRALSHYQQSIRYQEIRGNVFDATQTRCNVALTLANAGRLHDARLYSAAALRNYETYGDRAADKIQKTQQLLA
jgi:tetratricopeptide (TPR) repeat protein